jgi:putative membrane protein
MPPADPAQNSHLSARNGPIRRRWPASVYGQGTEPDPRFSLANERTLLAWVRTCLALIAAGVSVEVFLDQVDDSLRRLLAAALVVLGLVGALNAFGRWSRSERALRLDRPLPGQVFGAVLTTGIALVALALLVASFWP